MLLEFMCNEFNLVAPWLSQIKSTKQPAKKDFWLSVQLSWAHHLYAFIVLSGRSCLIERN